jgi:16S rRNA (guanine527-N7)-methyltransferase
MYWSADTRQWGFACGSRYATGDNRGVSEDLGAQIQRRATRVGLTVVPEVARRLEAYIGLLTKWNRRLNLTALELDPVADVAIDRLLIEPLVAAPLLGPQDRLLVDVGSGGGSPAVPLKAAAPAMRMVLVESKTRKSAFLREAIRELELADVIVETERFESLASRGELRDSVDVLTLRAVRGDDALWTATAGLLRPGGRVFWFGAPANIGSSISPSLRLVEMRTLMPESSNGLAILERQD